MPASVQSWKPVSWTEPCAMTYVGPARGQGTRSRRWWRAYRKSSRVKTFRRPLYWKYRRFSPYVDSCRDIAWNGAFQFQIPRASLTNCEPLFVAVKQMTAARTRMRSFSSTLDKKVSLAHFNKPTTAVSLMAIHKKVIQEAQLSQRDRAAACLNFDKNICANSVHLTLLYVRALTSVVKSRWLCFQESRSTCQKFYFL